MNLYSLPSRDVDIVKELVVLTNIHYALNLFEKHATINADHCAKFPIC